VVARQGSLLVAAFHPELTEDLRLHALFLALAGEKQRRPTAGRRSASPRDEVLG
jgi:hypothetical protein